MKRAIVVAAVLVATGIVWFFMVLPTFDAERPAELNVAQHSHSGDNCDTPVFTNVPFAICYKEGAIIETVRHGNLYEATVTTEWNYDYVEVYSNMKKDALLNTYTGKLYSDIRGRCA